MTAFRSVLLAAGLSAAIALPAVADAIDGKWCMGAKCLEIAGDTIVTPGGRKIQGDYGRHDFSYVVPADEANAGKTVDMDLMGDEDMRLWPTGRAPNAEAAGAQYWRRCQAETS